MTREEQDAVERYVTSYEQHIKLRLQKLSRFVIQLTGWKPVWNPLKQDFEFVSPTGRLNNHPELTKLQRHQAKDMFGKRPRRPHVFPD